MTRHLPYVIGGVLALALLYGIMAERYHTGVADAIAEEQARTDSVVAIQRDSARAAREYADSVALVADSVAREASGRVRRAEGRVSASRDSLAILRGHLDTLDVVPDTSFRAVVDQYEAVIADQDTIIAVRGRELAAERLRVRGLTRALTAVEAERDGLLRAVEVRDRQIDALRDALDAPSLWPDGLLGDLLKVGGGFALAKLAGA